MKDVYRPVANAFAEMFPPSPSSVLHEVPPQVRAMIKSEMERDFRAAEEAREQRAREEFFASDREARAAREAALRKARRDWFRAVARARLNYRR